MTTPIWEEYARVQLLVEVGTARDEQLDAMLKRHFDNSYPFDLYDSRRRQKNLDRNLLRKDHHRVTLLKRYFTNLGQALVEQPSNVATRRETAAAVRRVAGDDWQLLRATVDGDYATLAAEMGIAVGTIKSRVSRTRVRLKPALLEVV